MAELYCIKSPISLCNSKSNTCGGIIKVYSGLNARACGFLSQVCLCLNHYGQLSRRNESCCFPFDNDCSSGLQNCPTRFFSIFEEFNPHKVSTKICNFHLNESDKLQEIIGHPLYETPKGRKRSRDVKDDPIGAKVEMQKCILELQEKNKALQKIIDTQQEGMVDIRRDVQELENENLDLKNALKGDVQFETLFKAFHKAFARQHQTNHLYNPKDMEEFCKIHAPGLFDMLLTAILNEEKQSATSERIQKQKIRVVSLLHNMCFFRNQKINSLQKSNGLNLKMCGASYDSLMSGMLMGFSCHPNTVLAYSKQLAKHNKVEVPKAIKNAQLNESLVLLLEDDIHFIHCKKTPRSSDTSTAYHMCTAMVDIQSTIPAISRPQDPLLIHRNVQVKLRNGRLVNSRGGIDVPEFMMYFEETMADYFSSTYLEQLPREHRELDLSIAKESCENLRVYTGEDRHNLDILQSTWLVDEFLQNLHSKHDYRHTLQHITTVAPPLIEYMNDHLLVVEGDFPTWKYNKKIIAEWDPRTDPHYIGSLVPWQGPFHISLNIQESTVLLFRPIFEKLYKYLFGRNKVLPQRPKSEKIALLITSAFGGWTIVRNMVKQHFGPQCKDPQYMMLLHLFDEVLPLVFYFYVVIFRGGDFQHWLTAMFHIAMQFIIFRRRNYDKATLCHLSDVLYHQRTKPEMNNMMRSFLNVLTEKKVEVFHSKLRRAVPMWATPEFIQQQAHVLSAKRFEGEFENVFLQQYQRGQGQHDFSHHSFTTAEYLLDLFATAWGTIGQTAQIPRGRRQHQPYYLPALDATMDQRCFPLGYAFEEEHKPDPMLFCDHPNCIADDDSQPNIQRLSCGHSFHKCCLLPPGRQFRDHQYANEHSVICPVCVGPLRERIEKLALTMNRYLAGDDDQDEDGNNSEDDEDDSEDDDDNDDITDNKQTEDYYTKVLQFRKTMASRLTSLPKVHNSEPIFSNKHCKPK